MMIQRSICIFLTIFILSSSLAYSQSRRHSREEVESIHAQALEEHGLGRDSSAYFLTVKALAILRSLGDEKKPIYAECKHDAGIFALLGLRDKKLFSEHMIEAINIKYSLYGLSDDYYWSKESYADGLVYFANMEKLPEKISLLEESIEIYESLPEHNLIEGYIQSLNNLAVVYEYINAKKSIEFSLKELYIKRETRNPDTLIVLSNLSRFYEDLDNHKSLYYARLVLDIRKKMFPPDYDRIRLSHQRIASVYSHMRNSREAIQHGEEARKLAEKLYGKRSPEYAIATQNTGSYYLLSGDTLKALEYMTTAYNNPTGDRQGPATNLAAIYSSCNEVDSCYKYSKEAWSLFINREYIQNLCRLSKDNRFQYACTERSYVQMNQPILYFIRHSNYIGFKKLAFKCMLFSKNIIFDCHNTEDELLKIWNLDTDSIKSYLNENEVAIEFWSDKTDSFSWDGNIIVAILRKTYEAPLYVMLSKEKIYKSLRNEYETSRDYLPLYENIWKEIVEVAQLKEGERIYAALDDVLNQIPIEAIINYDCEYMGDKYDIVRVSSTGIIPKLTESINVNSAVLYGGLLYDSTTHKGDNNTLAKSPFPKNNMSVEIGDSAISELRSNTKYLPWTKTETDSIHQILSKTLMNNICVLQGERGTEESFKELSGISPSIIHIATHGFFIRPHETMDWPTYYTYCMDHSGLLMSGALIDNRKESETICEEDGFLKSTEVASLNLVGTQLVVLSACNTGLAGLTPLGVSGLQKAFKAAGAETMVLTLDDIDDAAAYLMMASFYKNLMQGFPKRTAFRKAQKILRESDLYKSSIYWASFVMLD